MCKDEIKTFLNAGGGSVRITLSSGSTTGIKQTLADRKASSGKYSLDGRKLKHTPSKGVYLENGKKTENSTDSRFAHLAFEIPGENTSNEWLEPVSDEE